MNISICITVLNEEGSISALLDSLVNQSLKASEIVIVDGGSSDKTVEIIRHCQKKSNGIKLIIEKSSRAEARNIAVEIAKGDIIAMTDAGCVADKDWIKNLTKPFETGNVDVVAGFYSMTAGTSLQKAESVFLGITPKKFDFSFLPSTRSIAFTKKIWMDIGGFPEKTKGTAEDTIFNYRLIKAGAKISRVKSATVEWGMPNSLEEFGFKIYEYAKGDAASKIWLFPGKGLTSHNIKALSVLGRYILGILLLIFGIKFHLLSPLLLIVLFLYLLWAYRKVFSEFGDWRISLWGPILQITSDVAVIGGFTSGILSG